ncbi:hypothetical protein [Massilia sp. SYSU DXS3249]
MDSFSPLLLVVTVIAIIFASYLLGVFSRIPLWSIGITTAALPMMLFCVSFPVNKWEEAMMIIGGYAVGLGPVFGLICYKVAKPARLSAQLAAERATIRATYGRGD